MRRAQDPQQLLGGEGGRDLPGDEGWEVAVLPFGATEPHNYHLPYGTDIFEADVVG